MQIQFFPRPLTKFQNSQFILFSGIQSSGRTLVMMSLLNQLLMQGKLCRWFSNTEAKLNLQAKLLSSFTKREIKNDPKQSMKVISELEKWDVDPDIFIGNTFRWGDIEKQIKELAGNGVEAFFIDSLFGISHQRTLDEWSQMLDFLGCELSRLAKELGVFIVASTPLSSNLGNRDGKHPYITDIPAPLILAEMADIIILFHRPELFGISENEKGESLQNLVQLFVAKSNSGGIGRFSIKLNPVVQSFDILNEEIEYKNFC